MQYFGRFVGVTGGVAVHASLSILGLGLMKDSFLPTLELEAALFAVVIALEGVLEVLSSLSLPFE